MSPLGAVRVVAIVWLISEVILQVATRGRRGETAVHDRGSLALIWIAVVVGIFAGLVLRKVPAAAISGPSVWLQAAGLLLLVLGLGIRWLAVVTLGRMYSTTVAVHQEHQLIRAGPYRRVRHPAYSGLLLILLGFALAHGNWLTLGAILVPSTAAILYRIRVEEASMIDAFGEKYADYRKSTKRLIPGVY
jgi:protein-S-isoprenylcysteine O-methyltransferase Ste14